MTTPSPRRSTLWSSAVLAVILSVVACEADAGPRQSAASAPIPSATAVPTAGVPPESLDVATWKGGNRRTGVTPGPGPAAKPDLLWDVPLAHTIESQPLVVDGTVIVTTAGGDLVGIDADTGKPAWETVHLGAGVVSQGAVDAGTLFVVTSDGMLHAVTLKDGTERWPALPGFDQQAVVSVDGELVIVGSPRLLRAIRVADGTQAWRANVEGAARLRVAVDGGFAYVTADNSGVMSKVDLANLDNVEQLPLGGADGGTATVDPDGVVVSYRDEPGGVNGVVAFGHDGKEVWRTPTLELSRVESATVADDLVVVSTSDPAAIELLDRSSGERLWARDLRGPSLGGNVVADGVVYLVTGEDGLIAIDLATRTDLWSVPFIASQTPVRAVVTEGLVIATAPRFDGAAHVVAYADPADPRSVALRSGPEPTQAAQPVPSAETPPIFAVLDAGTSVDGDVFMASPTLGPDGTLYLADPHTNRVLVRGPDGTISWWGTPGSGEGEFDFSDQGGNVSVSPDGALIAVAEGGNHRVQLFDAQRNFIKQIGRLGDGPAQFKSPGVTVDARHRLWVVDAVRSDVQLFDEHGTWVATFGGEGTGDGQLREPGIASFREDTGELYVADFGNRRVSVFDDRGWVRNYGSRIDEGLNLDSPNKVVVDEAGRMFVVDRTSRLHILDPDGHLIGMIPPEIPGVGPLDVPGFALDTEGRLYLSDVLQRRIVVLQLLPPIWPPPG